MPRVAAPLPLPPRGRPRPGLPLPRAEIPLVVGLAVTLVWGFERVDTILEVDSELR